MALRKKVTDNELATTNLDNAVPAVPDYSGTYAVFTKKNGNVVLVFSITGQEGDQSLEIPAFVIKMAEKYQGDPTKLLGVLGG